jgi:hypothetical protein
VLVVGHEVPATLRTGLGIDAFFGFLPEVLVLGALVGDAYWWFTRGAVGRVGPAPPGLS